MFRDVATAMVIAGLAGAQPAWAVDIADVIKWVQERGWDINHEPLCAELKLVPTSAGCNFKQVSVQELDGRGDPRSFNVPAGSASVMPYVLVFHLGPLVGEFFVVSPEGQLLTAFVRRKGTGYSQIPNNDVQEEFRKDLAYWIDNFARLTRGLDDVRARKPERRPQ
jgi:hypothetical protein